MRVAWWLAAGAMLLAAGCRIDSAEESLEHYVAGRQALASGEDEAALAELQWAIRANPKLSVTHDAIGDIYRRRGENEKAAAAYEAACRINPYAFRSHYNLGVTLQCLSAQARSPEAAAQYLQKSVHVYLRAITIRADDFDANLNVSACYFQQGRGELAEQYCKAAIQLDPRNPYAHSNLGIIYDAQGKLYDAIREYKVSLELETHQPKLLLNLGSTYMRLGRMKEALHAFDLAVGQDPASAAPWVQIGACRFYQSQWAPAEEAYRKALSLDANYAEAHRGLGVTYMAQFVLDAKRDDLRDNGLEAWQRSLELDANQPDLVELMKKYTPPSTAPKL